MFDASGQAGRALGAGEGFALVTGTSRGVGRAAALLLAGRGLTPLLVGRPSAGQRETERLLQQAELPFHPLPCDLADREAVRQTSALLLERFGAPRVIVHNAGIIHRAPLAELTDEAWDEQLEVNVSAPFRLTRACLPSMLARGEGRVLFVSSISALLGSRGQAGYNASKAALVALMRCLAEEVHDTGLMTAALLPGSIDTEMLRGSGFAPRMTAEDVARSLVYYALDAPLAHNGAVIEMFGV